MDYWKECVSIGLEEAGITATTEQIEIIASSVMGGFENYGMAHGHDVIRNYSEAELELKRIKKDMESNILFMSSTKPCRSCVDGTARDGWGRDITCDDCGGTGRVNR